MTNLQLSEQVARRARRTEENAWRDNENNAVKLIPMCSTIDKMVSIRDILVKNKKSEHRVIFNRAIINELKFRALECNDRFYLRDKCEVKGHDYCIAPDHGEHYANGFDVPVRCSRCGQYGM